MEETTAVRRLFQAAGIRPERWSKERVARLSTAERDLYYWILRAFAAGKPPTAEDARGVAARLGIDLEAAFARLSAEDLVHRDSTSGEIVVAYPFAGRTTGHLVRLDEEREVHAMCAIDALGIPFMLETPAEIVSHDPLTGEEIWVRVEPGEGTWWEPEQAVVFAGTEARSGPSSAVFCTFVNFFRSPESAGRYRRDHAGLQGEVLTIPEAVEAGRTVFGSLLRPVGCLESRQ